MLSEQFEKAGKECSHPTPAERHEEIAKIAHHIWEERNGGDSTAEEKHKDWVAAEDRYEHGHHHHGEGLAEEEDPDQA